MQSDRQRAAERAASGTSTGAAVDEERPNKRKKREHLNCAECRRLKLRCDRKVPCENCVKRSCQDLCPDGARAAVKPRSADTTKLQEQIDALVGLLGQHGVNFVPNQSQNNTASRGMGDNASVSSANQTRASRDSSETSENTATTDLELPQPVLPTGTAQGNPVLPSNLPEVTQAQTQTQTQAFRWSPGPSTSSTNATVTYQNMTAPNMSMDRLTQNMPMPNHNHNHNHSQGQSQGQTQVYQSFSHQNEIIPSLPSSGMISFSPNAEQSHGTLVISQSGRSKYLGPSAASEWLKDQEVIEESRPNSPPTNAQSRSSTPVRTGQAVVFPSASNQSTASLLQGLPARDEAVALVDCYYRYFGWSYEIVPRNHITEILDNAYARKDNPSSLPSKSFDAQSLALLFIVLAVGASHNLELAPADQIAEDLCDSARNCLTKGNFMTRNTLAGVQTLSLMAHYLLQTDRGRDGDASWPLWGLAMRIGQAMGLHRDGGKWNLPDDVVEDRRRVFWECHTAEVLQANCFSRPSSISPDFVDTLFPSNNQSFHALKFELCKLSERVLYASLSVHGTSVTTVREIYDQICSFERRIPFEYRCRAALVSLPSQYSDTSAAEANSPPLNRRDLRRTFESYWLALIISETIVNLQRPYFMTAMMEGLGEPTRSQHGQAFLSVLERCNVLIQIVCGLYEVHPGVTARHWWCWYHAFNSAVCLGTLLLMCPQNDFAPIALKQIDQVIAAYTSVIQLHASPRLVQNLRWLLRLRQRGLDRISRKAVPNPVGGIHGQPDSQANNDGDDIELDAGLVGWKTRLIERSGPGIKKQKATTVSSSGLTPTSISPLDIERVIQSMPRAVQEHIAPDTFMSANPDTQMTNDWLDQSTDQLLHNFWDPTMLLQDTSNLEMDQSTNWWGWLAPGQQ